MSFTANQTAESKKIELEHVGIKYTELGMRQQKHDKHRREYKGFMK